MWVDGWLVGWLVVMRVSIVLNCRGWVHERDALEFRLLECPEPSVGRSVVGCLVRADGGVSANPPSSQVLIN